MPAADEGAKIGLPNLKKQLNLIYPKRHSLLVEQTETFFTVALMIDLKPVENEDTVPAG